MKAVVAAFNQEKALVGAFSVITNLRMELFQALNGHGHLVPRLPAVPLRHLPGEVADRVGVVSPGRDHETFPGRQ